MKWFWLNSFFSSSTKKHVINVVCAYEWNIYLKLIPHSSVYKIPQKIMAHCIAYGIFFLGRNFNHKKIILAFVALIECVLEWFLMSFLCFEQTSIKFWMNCNWWKKFKRVEWHSSPTMTVQKWIFGFFAV